MLALMITSCGQEEIPVACSPEADECETRTEGGFQTGPTAGIAAGVAAIIALAGGGLDGDDGGSVSDPPATNVSDSQSPRILGVQPDNGSLEIDVTTNPRVVFSEAMSASSTTINADGSCVGSIQLSYRNEPVVPGSEDLSFNCVPASLYSTPYQNGEILTISPTEDLRFSTEYTLTLTTDLTDLSGNSLTSEYVSIFRTANEIGTSWAGTKQLGTSAADLGWGITNDSSGNVYVTGHTRGGFDGYTNLGESDLFVVKYNSSGVKQWSRQLGTSGGDGGSGITTDSSGNIYVVGSTEGSLGGAGNAGSSDCFIVKFNSSGVKQWTRLLGTFAFDSGSDITTDSSGNIYTVGYTGGDLAGNTHVGNEYFYDIFVVKHNNSGVKQWVQQLGIPASADMGRGITSDASGNVYVTGSTQGSLDGNTHFGESDLFVVKYSSSGVKQWSRQLGAPSDDWPKSITRDSNDNLFVAGDTDGGLDGNISAGDADIFIMKIQIDDSD